MVAGNHLIVLGLRPEYEGGRGSGCEGDSTQGGGHGRGLQARELVVR